MEPLTAGTIATLAINTALGETVKQMTTATLAKIKVLRDQIWNKLRVNPETATAFVKAEKGSAADLEKVVSNLELVMKSDPSFAQEVEKLVSEIQQEINIGQIQGQIVQNFSGDGQKNNAIQNNGLVIQGGSGHNITFN